MSVDLLTFTLVFIPIALIIGLASGTIGYTAWAIVVPLVFVVFGFGLYESLYISVFIDLVDSLYLIFKYSKKGKVDFKTGSKWGLVAIIGAIGGFILSDRFLANNQDILKGSVGYIVIVLGSFFIYKGFSQRKEKKATQFEKPENLSSLEKEIPANDNDRIDSKKKSDESQEVTSKTRFNPILSYLILFGGVLVSGALAGLVGLGSGMNFVLFFMIALGWGLRKSTGTGIYLMFLVMAFCAFAFASKIDFINIWPYMLISSSISLIGTIIGSYYAFKLPNDKLNLLVGSTMILAALIATFQTYLI